MLYPVGWRAVLLESVRFEIYIATVFCRPSTTPAPQWVAKTRRSTPEELAEIREQSSQYTVGEDKEQARTPEQRLILQDCL